jgi:hypothetical protein
MRLSKNGMRIYLVSDMSEVFEILYLEKERMLGQEVPARTL